MGCHSANRNNALHNALCEMDHHGIQGGQVKVAQDREQDQLQCDEKFLRDVIEQRDEHVCHGEQGLRDEQEHYDRLEHRGELGLHDEQGLRDGQSRDGFTHDTLVLHDGLVHCDEELNDAQAQRDVLIHGVQGIHVQQTHAQYVLEHGVVDHDVQAMDDVQELVRDVLQHRGVRAQLLCDLQLHGVHVYQHELNLVEFVQILKGGQVGQSDGLHNSHHKLHVPPHGHDGRAGNDYKFHGHVHVIDSHHEHQSLASECTIFQTCHIDALDALHHEQLDGQHVSSATHTHHDVVLSLLFQGIDLPQVLLRLHHRPRET